MIGHLKVWLAYVTNNCNGMKEDVHGRKYKDVYKKFGHRAMVKDYVSDNSWLIHWPLL